MISAGSVAPTEAPPNSRSGVRGRFITFEGGEGAGKSTQARLLCDALTRAGLTTTLTREPGGSPGAEDIRQLIVTGEAGRWTSKTEALLIAAARAEHVAVTVEPALAAGGWVVCDRFFDSTTAHQGCGRGVATEWLEQLRRLTVGDLTPDLTLIVDMPVERGLARALERKDMSETRFERMGLAFHTRLRDGFLAIAAAEPERCVVVDGDGTPEQVHGAVRAVVADRLGLDLHG
jgi:dTMP kinase